MSLQVEKLEHNMAKLTIEVSAEEVEKALQAAYLKERSKISFQDSVKESSASDDREDVRTGSNFMMRQQTA